MAGTHFPSNVVAGADVLKTPITALAGGANTAATCPILDGLYNYVGTVATGGDSVILPAGMPQFAEVFVYNNSAATCDVYPNTDGTLCGGTATTGQRGIATKTGSWFIQIAADGKTWIADNTIAAVS
jgi:hypothetical protein